MARLPDLILMGKLKGLTTKCEKDKDAEVLVTLQYEAVREAEDAKQYLGLGASLQGEGLDVVVFDSASGFRRTIRAVGLTGMAAKVAADESALIRVTWGLETLATLEEMGDLYSDFLTQRGAMHLIHGELRQKRLPLEVEVLRGGGAVG